MTDPFAAYAASANTIVNRPAKLLGVNKTRGEARQRVDAIVQELRGFQTKASLEEYLEILRPETAQFRAELDFYWEGEGDFLGLRKEIALAQARVDAGLDFPRWEPEATSSADLGLFSKEGNGQ
jgi:hypothetical protein